MNNFCHVCPLHRTRSKMVLGRLHSWLVWPVAPPETGFCQNVLHLIPLLDAPSYRGLLQTRDARPFADGVRLAIQSELAGSFPLFWHVSGIVACQYADLAHSSAVDDPFFQTLVEIFLKLNVDRSLPAVTAWKIGSQPTSSSPKCLLDDGFQYFWLHLFTTATTCDS